MRSTPPSQPSAGSPADLADAHEGLYVRQVSNLIGVSTSILRAWETEGLVSPARTTSGYRVYTMDDVRRVTRIRDLREQGINTSGVRRILEDEEQFVGTAPALDRDGLGARIRRLRRTGGRSLRELASTTNLSPSYLSSIERSLSSPSVASLQKIAAALGTNMVGLLDGEADSGPREVVRADERITLHPREDGVEMHRLAVGETMLEPLLFTLDPGAGSDGAYEHDGEEFIFVLSGTFEITLDAIAVHHLAIGDSITFRSRRPHTWTNPGTTPCVLVWVNTPPTF